MGNQQSVNDPMVREYERGAKLRTEAETRRFKAIFKYNVRKQKIETSEMNPDDRQTALANIQSMLDAKMQQIEHETQSKLNELKAQRAATTTQTAAPDYNADYVAPVHSTAGNHVTAGPSLYPSLNPCCGYCGCLIGAAASSSRCECGCHGTYTPGYGRPAGYYSGSRNFN